MLCFALSSCSRSGDVEGQSEALEPEFPLLSGEVVKLSEMRGKVILINYWAIWCKPCREEIPELNKFQQDFPADVSVLGVNFDGVSDAQLASQVSELAIQYSTLLVDPREYLGIKPSGVLPETIVIDRRGEFHRILLGPQSYSDLELLLSSLVEDVNYNGSP
ncbi:MAG: TlpA disulfide reductase family protein [bacterium]